MTPGARSRAPPGDRGGTVQRDGRLPLQSLSPSLCPRDCCRPDTTHRKTSARLIRNQLDRPEEFSFMSSNCPFDSPAVLVCNCEWTFIHSFIHLELSDRGRLRATATSQCIFRLPWRDTDAHGMEGDATCHLCPTSFFPPLCTCALTPAACTAIFSAKE